MFFLLKSTHTSGEVEDSVETHVCKPRVILRSRLPLIRVLRDLMNDTYLCFPCLPFSAWEFVTTEELAQQYRPTNKKKPISSKDRKAHFLGYAKKFGLRNRA